MTAVAAEADPYLLPAAAPGSPVVLPERISSANPHPVSRYQDLTWSLAPLIDNPGVPLWKIHWKDCPPQLRGPLRQAAWAMINGELRPTYLQTRGPGAGAPPRPSTTPAASGCGSPAGCTSAASPTSPPAQGTNGGTTRPGESTG